MNVGDSFIKQLAEIRIFIGDAIRRHAKATGNHLHLTEYHFGMINRVAIHRDTVFIGVKMYPRRFDIDDSVSLLKYQDI